MSEGVGRKPLELTHCKSPMYSASDPTEDRPLADMSGVPASCCLKVVPLEVDMAAGPVGVCAVGRGAEGRSVDICEAGILSSSSSRGRFSPTAGEGELFDSTFT
jgi:hypothetical protein